MGTSFAIRKSKKMSALPKPLKLEGKGSLSPTKKCTSRDYWAAMEVTCLCNHAAETESSWCAASPSFKEALQMRIEMRRETHQI